MENGQWRIEKLALYTLFKVCEWVENVELRIKEEKWEIKTITY